MTGAGQASFRRAFVVTPLLSMLLLSGCWHTIPLEKRGLVSMLAVDQAPGGGYRVSVAVVSPPGLPAPGPSGQSGGQGGPVVLLRSSVSPSVVKAIHDLTETTYLHLDFTHLHEMLVSEAVARAGLATVLEYPARSLEFNQSDWLLITRGTGAAELMERTQQVQPRPGEVLSETVRWNRLHTPYPAERVFTFLKKMLLAGDEPTTVGVSVASTPGGPRTTPFRITGLAMFRRDRLVGWLDGERALGWAIATGRVHHLPLVVPRAGGHVDLELMGSRRRVAVSEDHGTPRIQLTLSIEADLVAAQGTPADYWRQPQRLHSIGEAAAQIVQHDVEQAIRAAQSDGTDVFSLGEYVRLQDVAAWRAMRENWNQRDFGRVPVDVRVRVHVGSVGEILSPLLGN